MGGFRSFVHLLLRGIASSLAGGAPAATASTSNDEIEFTRTVGDVLNFDRTISDALDFTFAISDQIDF